MENEVDEEIYKILHTNFDSIQKDDDEVKSNKISVISESRNSKSIQMNPNKYCKNITLQYRSFVRNNTLYAVKKSF